MLLFSLLIFYGFFAVIWIHEKLEIFSESPGHQSCSCVQLRSAVYGCSIRTSEKPIQISTMYNTKIDTKVISSLPTKERR